MYIMWAEIDYSHFLYMPAVSNIVTNGNGMGTKNVLKGTMHLSLCLVSSLLCTALKVLPEYGLLYVFTLCMHRNRPI